MRISLLVLVALAAMKARPAGAQTATPSNDATSSPAPDAPVAPASPAPAEHAPPYEATRPSGPPPDSHTHSGFFLRMSLGTGFMGDAVSLSEEGYAGSVTAKGPAVALEIDIGASIVPGLSVSGTFLIQTVADTTLSNDSRTYLAPGSTVPADSRLAQDPQVSIIGVMVDHYPNPETGFHWGGALGFASMEARRGNDGDGTSGGFAIAPHAGYEWWVADDWGLGVLGRLLYSRTRGPYAAGMQTDKVVTITVAFSATYN